MEVEFDYSHIIPKAERASQNVKNPPPPMTNGRATNKKVERADFEVLSPATIISMSSVEIDKEEIFSATHERISGGLFDPMLGPAVHRETCMNCGASSSVCPGHYGFIVLSQPVYHPFFIDTVLKMLRMVCYDCGAFLANTENRSFTKALEAQPGMARFGAMSHAVKGANKHCPLCDKVQPLYKRTTGGMNIFRCFPEDAAHMLEHGTTTGSVRLRASEARRTLSQVSQSAVVLMGLPRDVRPEWMLAHTLLVPPPSVRPTVITESGAKNFDDLTILLRAVIKNSILVRKEMDGGATDKSVDARIDQLQLSVARLFDNDTKNSAYTAATQSGRALKGLRQRFKGKEGRMRGNIMGKRVDFSARTVITPDPTLALDEVGVPRSIAMDVTRTVKVTKFNIEALQRKVDNGPDDLDGAVSIIHSDGSRVDLRVRHRSHEKALSVGDKVERFMQTGDRVVFNRQPSLHKMSMMGHRVRVMNYSTFRLNVSVTTPYNADFDGDEMNLHLPQSDISTSEVSELMMVPTQIVAAAKNQPIIGLVQDSLLTAHKITSRDVFIERDVFFNLVMQLDNWNECDPAGNGISRGISNSTGLVERVEIPKPAILRPRPMWTGKQVMDLFMPPINIRCNVDMEKGGSPNLSANDGFVQIVRGKLLCGRLCKRTLGTSRGSIIHVIWQDFGKDAACKFLTVAQFVLNYWMLQHGHTVGVSDCVPPPGAHNVVESAVNESYAKAAAMTKQAQSGTMEQLPARTYEETFEANMDRILNEGFEKAGASIRGMLTEENNIYEIIKAGSKGTNLNITQVSAIVGQQRLMGGRIPTGFRSRTLPHYCCDDKGPLARGFVRHSFIDGLTPSEMWFHAVGGREGLVDTAVKTAETGYIQRRLVKALEDMRVSYDGTVREMDGSVQQFYYGEDGMDGQRRVFQKIELLTFSNVEMMKHFPNRWGDKMIKRIPLTKHVASDLVHDPEGQALLCEEHDDLTRLRDMLRTDIIRAGKSITDAVNRAVPVPLSRIIEYAQQRFGVQELSDLSPARATEEIRGLCQSLAEKARLDEHAMVWTSALLRGALCGVRAVCDHHLSREAFDWIKKEIEDKFLTARVEAGEMVGALAAQSVGEPLTQMTLNSFHFAGVGVGSVIGVPRFREILNATKSPHSPMMYLYPERDRADDPEDRAFVLNICKRMVQACFSDVLDRADIVYDPDPTESTIEGDREFLSTYFWSDDVNMSRVSPFSIRLVLDADALFAHDAAIRTLVSVVKNNFEASERVVVKGREQTWFYFTHSEDNAGPPVIRIFEVIGDDDFEGGHWTPNDSLALMRVMIQKMSTMHVKGIERVRKTHIEEYKGMQEIDAEGRVVNAPERLRIITEGSNIFEAMAFPGLRKDLTRTNDIIEATTVLGIEGGRAVLLDEIRNVLLFGGGYLDDRHMLALGDFMSHYGTVTAINRHGLTQAQAGPLCRATFERTTTVLTNAGVYGEGEKVDGVSNSIILGQPFPGGTCSFGLMLDSGKLKDVGSGVEEEEMSIDQKLMSALTHNKALFGSNVPSPEIGDFIPSDALFSPPTSPVRPFGGNLFGRTGTMGTKGSLLGPMPSFNYAQTSPMRPMASPMYNLTSPVFARVPASPASPASPTSPVAAHPSLLSYSPTSPYANMTSPRAVTNYSQTSPSYMRFEDVDSGLNSGSAFGAAATYSPTSPRLEPEEKNSISHLIGRTYGANDPQAYSPMRVGSVATFGPRVISSNLYSPRARDDD